MLSNVIYDAQYEVNTMVVVLDGIYGGCRGRIEAFAGDIELDSGSGELDCAVLGASESYAVDLGFDDSVVIPAHNLTYSI